MKVLFCPLMRGQQHAASAGDYLMDVLFHGLQNTEDVEVVETDYMWHNYKCEKETDPENNKRLWGKGFTTYFLCDPSPYQHQQKLDMLMNKEFDVVIMSIHHTMAHNYSDMFQAMNHFKKFCDKVAIVDGHDQTGVNHEIASKCTYFKRELIPEHEDKALPVSFAYPEEKIYQGDLKSQYKTQAFSSLIPVNQSINPEYMQTYVYETEEDYYRQYQQSHFGLTSCKGGWDTMRHYEIIGNGCVPLFVDIDKCPNKTLHLFPKELCKEALNLTGLKINHPDWTPENPYLNNCNGIEIGNPGSYFPDDMTKYRNLQQEFMNYMKNNLTTKHLAKYMLEEVCR